MAAPFTAAMVGLGKLVKTAEEPAHAFGIFPVVLRAFGEKRFQIVEIHARAKRLARSGDDQHPGWGLLDFIEGGEQFIDQLKADGVALLGTVQRDCGDRRIALQLNCGVVHAKCREN